MSTEPSRMERALARLTRTLARFGGASERDWALELGDTPLNWPEDLPALPEDARMLLGWRSHSSQWASSLFLPTLYLGSWQECAERARADPSQLHLSTMLRLDERGVWNGEEPLTEHLVELVELEALALERLPGSLARRVRVEGPLAPWQPCPDPGPEALDACPPGTLFCSSYALSSTLFYALKLGQRMWALHFGPGPEPGEPADLLREARMLARSGELCPRPIFGGERHWRSSITVWTRDPMERLLVRLDEALSVHAPWLRETLLSPEPEAIEALEQTLGFTLPESLRQLWQFTSGSDSMPFRQDYALMSPSQASAFIEALEDKAPSLIPLLTDGYERFVCVDSRGDYAPRGAVVAFFQGSPELTVLYESLEDWLEAFVLEMERGLWDPDDSFRNGPPGPLDELIRPGFPYELLPDSLQRAGAVRVDDEPLTPLDIALSRMEGDSHGLRLMQQAALDLVDFEPEWQDQPEGPASLQVLRDWLLEREAPLGTATLARLVIRLFPLLEPS